MRGITIIYTYNGDEDVWRTAIDGFVNALDGDAEIAGKFTYQVSVADDGETRVHWGRWDNQDTLKTVQSRPYFAEFAARVKEFSGGGPKATPANVVTKTSGW